MGLWAGTRGPQIIHLLTLRAFDSQLALDVLLGQ